jgi:dTDP-glucose 4,6-dehydratase
MKPTILVTGGAGFIGSNFAHYWLRDEACRVVVLDKLTYAGNMENLADLQGRDSFHFCHGDICDRELVRSLLATHTPAAVVHFAAESHVDRSILGPEEFLRTNVQGTCALLDESRRYWDGLAQQGKQNFRFMHISTDEVYGSLDPTAAPFREDTSYAPNSPYAASKAASDHFVRAWFHTYGLPTLTTNCSNNYGPYQFPEKLIPLMLLNALAGKPLPVYGDGGNVRDWLFVEDHCAALAVVLQRGRPGETYNVGGSCEKSNLEVIDQLCTLLDDIRPKKPGYYKSLITFVKDRPGHDRRYAINASKIREELGWTPRESFQSGMRKTVEWYLDHQPWVQSIQTGTYSQWLELNYKSRGSACAESS